MQDHEDRVDTDRALAGWLRELAEADAASGASPTVHERLLEEVRTQRRARRVAAIKMHALAAGLVIATALPVWQLTTLRSPDQSPRTALSATDTEVATVFFPLAYGTLPVTHASLVRVEVSPAAFAALGVEPLDASRSQRDVVLADVLVGEDGLARAVRFVRPARSSAQEQRP
jgi:hypothetical protein